jgi:hypothetical protein
MTKINWKELGIDDIENIKILNDNFEESTVLFELYAKMVYDRGCYKAYVQIKDVQTEKICGKVIPIVWVEEIEEF